MTALPDTIMPDRALPAAPQIKLPDPPEMPLGLGGMARRFVGAVSLLAAAGVWLMPVVPGDTGLQLIKLCFSVGFAVGGIAGLMATPRGAGPEICIDPHQRRISLVEHDAKGRVRAEIVHDFDALGEVVMRDGWLTARDTGGRQLISLPITDARVEAALREMFAGR